MSCDVKQMADELAKSASCHELAKRDGSINSVSENIMDV